MKTVADLLKEHTFFHGLLEQENAFIAGCGKNVYFKEGEMIARRGDPANEFYLIRQGKVSLTIEAPPRKSFLYCTLGENEIFGLAWLIPPYQWSVSAVAEEGTKVIALDGACLRKKCEKDTNMGYKLMQNLVRVMVVRENAALLHLLDIYGEQNSRC